MNIAEKLAGEVERVTILRERYRAFVPVRQARADMTPAIGMMTAAIDHAKRAIGEGDAVEMIRALKELEGFTD